MGVCGLQGGVGVSPGVGLFVAGVCGFPGVRGGESRVVGPFVCGFLGGWAGIVLAGPGAVCAGFSLFDNESSLCATRHTREQQDQEKCQLTCCWLFVLVCSCCWRRCWLVFFARG